MNTTSSSRTCARLWKPLSSVRKWFCFCLCLCMFVFVSLCTGVVWQTRKHLFCWHGLSRWYKNSLHSAEHRVNFLAVTTRCLSLSSCSVGSCMSGTAHTQPLETLQRH